MEKARTGPDALSWKKPLLAEGGRGEGEERETKKPRTREKKEGRGGETHKNAKNRLLTKKVSKEKKKKEEKKEGNWNLQTPDPVVAGLLTIVVHPVRTERTRRKKRRGRTHNNNGERKKRRKADAQDLISIYSNRGPGRQAGLADVGVEGFCLREGGQLGTLGCPRTGE